MKSMKKIKKGHAQEISAVLAQDRYLPEIVMIWRQAKKEAVDHIIENGILKKNVPENIRPFVDFSDHICMRLSAFEQHRRCSFTIDGEVVVFSMDIQFAVPSFVYDWDVNRGIRYFYRSEDASIFRELNEKMKEFVVFRSSVEKELYQFDTFQELISAHPAMESYCAHYLQPKKEKDKERPHGRLLQGALELIKERDNDKK